VSRRSFTPLEERVPNTATRIHLLTNREFNCLDILGQYHGDPVQAHEIARAMHLTTPTAKRFLWIADTLGLIERVQVDVYHKHQGSYGGERIVTGFVATPLGRELFASALHEIDRRIEGAA